MPPDFNIVIGMEGDAVAVSVSGKLDSDSAASLRDVLLGILRAGHRHLVVDLVRIASVDAAVQQMLTRVLKRVRSQGGDMIVRRAAVSSLAPW